MSIYKINPAVAVLFSALFWGTVWYPLRHLELAGLSGPWQVLISYGAAYLVLLYFFSIQWQLIKSNVAKSVLLALVTGWANIGFLLALLDGTVMRVMLLFFLSPAWTAILGHFVLAEKVRLKTAVMISVGLLGCALMLWDPKQAGGLTLYYADWLALTAGVAFAATNVMTRHLTEMNVATKNVVGWAGVLVIAILFIFLNEAKIPDVSGQTLVLAIILGVFGFLLATLAVIYGVSNMPVQSSSVLLLFEIVAGGLSAWILVGEGLSLNGWIGGLLIMSSAVMAARYAK